jgi:CRP-like cAMP-binding protein
MDYKTLQTCIAQILPLSDDDIALLAGYAISRKLKKGEILLKEGEVCRSFYLVENGYLRTWYDKNGVPINLNFTFEGNFTTNLKSFRSRRPSEINIEAGEDSLISVFNINSVAEAFGANPEIMRFVRRLAISLLLASEEHSDLFKIYTPAERYRYIEKNNPQLLQRISLSQIASYLGVTRETLSRIRAKGHRLKNL